MASSRRQKAKDKTKKPTVGRWTVVKKLGQGAYGKVYMVHEPEDDSQHFALKAIAQSDVPRKMKKIKREIAILQVANHHPNCVKLFEVTNSKKQFHLLMECCNGGTLFDAIIDRSDMPLFTEVEAKGLTRQICEALEYLHSKDIAHRDLKPENILFADEERTIIKLADFGLSKAIPQGDDGGHVTALHTRVGTLNYIAPEVLHKGIKTYGFKCDVWSVGIILYVMFCGYYPYGQDNQDALLRAIVKRPIQFPADEWQYTTKETRDFIRQLCSKDPIKRLSSAQSLVHPWLNPEGSRSFPVSEISSFLNKIESQMILSENERVVQDLKDTHNLTQAHARKFLKKYRQKLLVVVKDRLKTIYDESGVIDQAECVAELQTKFGLDNAHAEEQVQEFIDRVHPLENYNGRDQLNEEELQEYLQEKFDYLGVGHSDGHFIDHTAEFEGNEDAHEIDDFTSETHMTEIINAMRKHFHIHLTLAEELLTEFREHYDNAIMASTQQIPQPTLPTPAAASGSLDDEETEERPQNRALFSARARAKAAAIQAGAEDDENVTRSTPTVVAFAEPEDTQ